MSFLSAEFMIQMVVAMFGAGGISVFVNGWRDKRKADAEAGKENASAADVIQGSSKRQVEWLDGRLVAINIELQKEKLRSNELEEKNLKLVRSIRAHEEWDEEVVREMSRHGITLRPPPRLEL